MAVTFDLFGTLVDVPKPADPADAIAAELDTRGVAVPAGWGEAYYRPQIDAPEGAEIPLPAHVGAALRACGIDAPENAARQATVAAFDPAVHTRERAREAVAAARERGPVGVLSNCSVPELVGRTLIRSDLDRGGFDAIVSSVGCGWRKPHPEAFAAVADGLDRTVEDLTHVGDSPDADGGIEAHGGRGIVLDGATLADVPTLLEGR